MLKFCLVLTVITSLLGCAVTPDHSDTEGPTITLSQVLRGEVKVFSSTDPSVVINAPDQCPDGHLLIGTFWQVSGFPIKVLVSSSDDSGVEWLRLVAEKGILSTPDPTTVNISLLTVDGTEYYVAQANYPVTDPRSARLFTVMVTPKPGETIVALEGGSRDFSSNTEYTYLTQIGTNDALCRTF